MSNSNLLSEKSATIIAVFIAGFCSIIYELLVGTTTSYFLGDSVKQFSITIGVYMAAMGVGSYVSKFIQDRMLIRFIIVELCLGTIGGISVPLLYYCFEQVDQDDFQIITLSLIFTIGFFTGLEIPLLARIMKKYYPLKANLANVLSLDYLGALFATLIFPFLLLPFLGVFRTSVFFGIVNIGLGFFILAFFQKHLSTKVKRRLQTIALLMMIGFVGLFSFAKPIISKWNDRAFSHQVIFSKQTPYQNITVTKNRKDIRLYINRIIQFSSLDEYRYHESLALVPLSASTHPKKVLILGGGEGLLAREILKDDRVQEVIIVDLDEEIFKLGKENKHLLEINKGILKHPKVRLVVQDAFSYLKHSDDFFDLIIADLPDPSTEAVARLYSTYFFEMIRNRLSKHGVFATQATGVFHTNDAFWCIVNTLKASKFKTVYPYHAYVPSFGDWGFVIAANHSLDVKNYQSEFPTRFLNAENVERMFFFEPDINEQKTLAPNQLDRPVLLSYYLKNWKVWSKEIIK